MKENPIFPARPTKRFSVRIRPGGVIAIPRPILLALGGNPAKILIGVKANRLVLERRKSPAEVRIESFKTKLAERFANALHVDVQDLHAHVEVPGRGCEVSR